MSTDEHPQPPGPQPGAGTGPAGGPAPGSGFFDSIRRMGVHRSDDRWVGGVAGGLADRFGLDPLLVRGLLILSFFLTGAGIVVYAVGWALLPEQRDGRIHLQQSIRGDFDVALLGAIVVMIVGFAWGDGLWSWSYGAFDWVGGLLWIAVWVAIVWLVVKLVRDRRGRRARRNDGPTGPGGPAAGPGGTPGWDGGPVPSPAPGTPQDHFTPAPPAPYVATSATAPAGAPFTGSAYTEAPFTGAAAARPAPAVAPAPPAPPAPPVPVPPRPARRGPGAGAVGIVIGLVLLAGALLLVADRVGDLGSPLVPTWLGTSIVIVGLGIVVTGLRGRRGGVLTFLAILALITGAVTWPFSGDDDWGRWQGDVAPRGATISDGTLTPTTIAEAEDGVVVRLGSATVDLTELDLSEVTPGDPVVVPISMAAGSTRVQIPEGEAVKAEVDVIAGNVTWHTDDQTRSVNTYTDGPARFTTDEVRELDGARLLLEVNVRAGDLTIEESR